MGPLEISNVVPRGAAPRSILISELLGCAHAPSPPVRGGGGRLEPGKQKNSAARIPLHLCPETQNSSLPHHASSRAVSNFCNSPPMLVSS
eukprot:10444459-Heterocapsa_arctica.AAC.1